MKNKSQGSEKTLKGRFLEIKADFRQTVTDLQKNSGNENGLYRLRITLKKTCSFLDFMSSVPLEGTNVKIELEKFRILQKKIAGSRDAQVQHRQFAPYKKKYLKSDDLFSQWLNLRKYHKNKVLENTMQNLTLSFYMELYDQVAEVIEREGDERIMGYAPAFFANEVAVCEEHGSRIKKDYHKLRVHIKKIHYLLEILGILPAELLVKTKPLEKLLGNAHDLQNGKDRISAFINKHKLPASTGKNLKKLSAIMEKKKKTNLAAASQKAIPILEEVRKVTRKAALQKKILHP